ncbi:MAG: methylenetetrahydrofolate--tRNA-(uracil(54)-C(5))-methyltransferase (FADH(2)-oxidizing) TrmFO [Coriobacteriales bacterium]|jgi:methylenetetrahydrofolate--tRNA-(uracil-5-)-methyltransferase
MRGESGHTVTVVGGGLAGCEAAFQLADRGVHVVLHEMRPGMRSPAHSTDMLGELVCSNSLKSLDGASAAGVLKYELGALGSMLLDLAIDARIPAGLALAVDRDVFAEAVTKRIDGHPCITVVHEEVRELPDAPAIIATGPLTSDALAAAIDEELGSGSLSFYDAAAPIVSAASLDRTKVFAQSRYGKGGGADYLNAPFTRDEYEAFMDALLSAERVVARDFERKELFSACQPVEEIARTGMDALRYGPLKPVGLEDPRTGKRPWAVVQLRAENAALTAYNLVGFQTNLRHGEQERVFRMIPGLEHAEFERFGVMHRNTFVDSPHVLGPGFEVPGRPGVRFAGQLTGTEGYCEAIASGLLAALGTYADLIGAELPPMPTTSVLGALFNYATDPDTKGYQPMHVNYGIIDPLPQRVKGKQARYRAYAARAREAILSYRGELVERGIVTGDPSVPDAVLAGLPDDDGDGAR